MWFFLRFHLTKGFPIKTLLQSPPPLPGSFSYKLGMLIPSTPGGWVGAVTSSIEQPDQSDLLSSNPNII